MNQPFPQKNRRRRNRKKKSKKKRAQEKKEQAEQGQQKKEGGDKEKEKEKEPEVEIEYVTEEPEIYDPNYIFFKRIFEAFKVRNMLWLIQKNTLIPLVQEAVMMV